MSFDSRGRLLLFFCSRCDAATTRDCAIAAEAFNKTEDPPGWLGLEIERLRERGKLGLVGGGRAVVICNEEELGNVRVVVISDAFEPIGRSR